MTVVDPGTINHCANNCRKRIKYGPCAIHPEEFRLYGNICKKCVPSAVVRSITAESIHESEDPSVNEVLLVISDSIIVFDKYKVGTRGENEYSHLFGGGRMVGCGINNESDNTNIVDNCTNKIIYKIKQNTYDKDYKLCLSNKFSKITLNFNSAVCFLL